MRLLLEGYLLLVKPAEKGLALAKKQIGDIVILSTISFVYFFDSWRNLIQYENFFFRSGKKRDGVKTFDRGGRQKNTSRLRDVSGA